MSDFEVRMVTMDISPHDNADALEVAKIRNTEYTSVVPKGKFQSGDEALYIPDQAIVPDWILEELGLTGKLAGSKHNRVKPLNLRGVLSQGILYRPSDHAFTLVNEKLNSDNGETFDSLIETLDWSEVLNITKWVPEVPVDMAGIQYAPDAIMPYTNINDIRKYPKVIEEGEAVVITEKIHGTCAIFHFVGGVLHVSSKGVASKGLAIEEDENNLYWRVANSLELRMRLMTLARPVVTLFGEIYGVQDLMYGRTKGHPGFRAFDLAYDGQFVNYDEFMRATNYMNIDRVPDLYAGPFHYNFLEDFATGKETVTGNEVHIREGVVVRPQVERRDFRHGRVIFKYVSGAYLNRKGNTTEFE